MTSTVPMMVNCGCHGERISAVVCRHMLKTQPAPAGFVENCSDPNDLQAWCYRCEQRYEQEGAMNEAFKRFNDMTIVCVVCYREAKARHSIQEA
jgi:hypothetical protein